MANFGDKIKMGDNLQMKLEPAIAEPKEDVILDNLGDIKEYLNMALIMCDRLLANRIREDGKE